MIELIIEEVKDKEILILGLGREGVSTLKFLQRHLPNKKINILDARIDDVIVSADFDKNKIEIVWGDVTTELLDRYDVIFKTPGICFKNLKLDKKLEEKITSQTNIFLKYFKGKSVGITGTKGKSTTASLIYKIVKDNTDNTVLVGNIGIPIFDKIEEINNDTIVVIEISSHQLEFVRHSPYISVLLNIFEEHLDHYNSYQDYINAKLNIFCNNKETKIAIFNKSLEKEVAKFNIEKNIPVDFEFITKNNRYIYFENEIYYNFSYKTELLGAHNKYNILVAIEVINALKIKITDLSLSINGFKSLPNRLEDVGIHSGIHFYNDSISTIPETTISCIDTLQNLKTIIIGGFDRGVNYTSLIEKLDENKSIKTIICLPTTGHKIASQLKDNNIKHLVLIVNDLEEAVKAAYKNTKEGEICVMSPGAASFNQFKNFEERGQKYKEYIVKYEK